MKSSILYSVIFSILFANFLIAQNIKEYKDITFNISDKQYFSTKTGEYYDQFSAEGTVVDLTFFSSLLFRTNSFIQPYLLSNDSDYIGNSYTYFPAGTIQTVFKTTTINSQNFDSYKNFDSLNIVYNRSTLSQYVNNTDGVRVYVTNANQVISFQGIDGFKGLILIKTITGVVGYNVLNTDIIIQSGSTITGVSVTGVSVTGISHSEVLVTGISDTERGIEAYANAQNTIKSLQIYPNPSAHFIYLQDFSFVIQEPLEYFVSDIVGNVWLYGELRNNESIDISPLSNGIYSIIFPKIKLSKKLIKN